MPPELHIAGIVVHASPARMAEVRHAIAGIAGTEIHAEGNGKLVVTIEATGAAELADRVTAIGRLDGVLTAAPVYHHAETPEDTPCSPAAM
jgi:nitrate reductase NapD